ncbi:hypothetical protein IIV31_125R [Armadillidium vulgare iridescent virus]|uniref:Uncharacterized protein n=1 Tax=Armadillidium vulgare iridescent virus TaxID=72201 RepID=A0A068QKE3_9VIRU|nr:hypothetical protein IIV31_125R [Armadillidium vulgare iridescent virus]CCV02497.1 hypothetical protein IIV31_125R [Armadillidium vulgare iridescent virus]
MTSYCVKSLQQDSLDKLCLNKTTAAPTTLAGAGISGDEDIDMQNLFTIRNLKDPVEDSDACNKSFVKQAIESEAVHLKLNGGRMTGNINMSGLNSITQLKDAPSGAPDADKYAATKGYVDLKIASIIPQANLNLLSSGGCSGGSGGSSVFRYFPSGLILPKGAKITKVSLTTTTIAATTKHILQMYSLVTPFTGSLESQEIMQKIGTETHKTTPLSPWKILDEETSIFFELQSSPVSGSGTVPVFNGQSYLVVHVELA